MQPDTDSELSDVRDVTAKEKGSLESFLIERMSQIPEVESIYKYEDGAHTVFFTILSTVKYQRNVDTKVYEVEYMIFRANVRREFGFRHPWP